MTAATSARTGSGGSPARCRAPAARGGSRWLALTAALLLVACSTVEQRIGEHAALFESLDAETRAELRSGSVRLGHTMSMAYIALGAPDEVRHSTTAAGEHVIWRYLYTVPVHDGYHLLGFHRFSVHDGGARRHLRYSPFADHYRYETREYVVLVFEAGRVVSIERIG